MWEGWVIGYVLSVGRKWWSEAVTPRVKRPARQVRLKDKKDQTDQRKGRDRERYRFSRLRRLLLMRMDRMKLQRNLFVDMFSISTV